MTAGRKTAGRVIAGRVIAGRVIAGRVAAFLRCERGTMAWAGLSFTLLALLAGGVSIDIMRHENSRARVQQALDFCTRNVATNVRPGTFTAAASSPSSAPVTAPTNTELATAIKSCLDRLGPGALAPSVTAAASGNFKPVASTAAGTQTNQFMQMLSLNTVGLNIAANAAVPATARVEVALAFEASNGTNGSMATMKAGLADFVTRLTDTSGSIVPSITLVPYGNGVNMSATLLARYNGVVNTSNVANSLCIDVPSSEFSTVPVLTTTTGYRTMLYFDMQSTTNVSTAGQGNTYFASTTTTNGTIGPNSVPCPAQTTTVIRPQQDATAAGTMINQINATAFFGGVRWEHGMHWAAAMLDPSANAAVGTLGSVSVNTRPLAYGTADLQKVIVYVNKSATGTPQTNTALAGNYDTIATGYTTGSSPIWRNASNLWCIDLPERTISPKSFRPDTGTWVNGCNSLAGYTQLTWPQVWSSVRMQWVAWQLYARGLQTATTPTSAQVQATFASIWPSRFQSTITFATQTTNFLAECTAAKAAGIVIYTVGLDAVDIAKSPLQSCATSPNHYFDATSATFSDVMKLIAQTVNQQGYSQ